MSRFTGLRIREDILFLGTDTGEFENLGGVESTAGNDDFLSGLDRAGRTAVLCKAGAGVGAVEGLSVQVFDTIGLRLAAAALGLVERNLGDEGV